MGQQLQKKLWLVMGQEGQQPPISHQFWAAFYTRPTTVAAFDSWKKELL